MTRLAKPARHRRRRTATWHIAAARGGRRLVLNGRVQGLGVRPAIVGLACKLALGGNVRNTAARRRNRIGGTAPGDLDQFQRLLPKALPQGTLLSQLFTEPLSTIGRTEFTIVKQRSNGPLAARVPEDRAAVRELPE